MNSITRIASALFISLALIITFTAPCYVDALDIYAEAETITEVEKKASTEILEKETLVNIEIPTDTYAKTYEDGGLITDPSSRAYSWISKCYISNKGHYMYEDCYAVAMGSYFGKVGNKFKVTLDSGKTFKVIKCDAKQDRHTTNGMIDGSGAILEFIIDTDTAGNHYGYGSNGYILNGSFNNHKSFKGDVVKIELIEEE